MFTEFQDFQSQAKVAYANLLPEERAELSSRAKAASNAEAVAALSPDDKLRQEFEKRRLKDMKHCFEDLCK